MRPKFVTLIKIAAVLAVGATLTVASFKLAYFRTMQAEVSYGIWYGFPFGYYFAGYFIDSSMGNFPSWLPLNYWVIKKWLADFAIYTALTGSILILIELGLKKLFKIEW